MRSVKPMVLAGITLALLAAGSPAQQNSQAGWEKSKTLAGKWEGRRGDGLAVRSEFQLRSADSALLETLQSDETMVTVYHLDNEHLMMTHYCAAKNQPRMRAESLRRDARQITFTFLDGTNLQSPGPGHMRKLVVTFLDADHYRQDWTFRLNDGQEHTEKFEFTRVK